MQTLGIIKGNYIELTRETGIPDGTGVLVDIHLLKPTLLEQHRLIDQLCGSWAGDPSIPGIFAEIEKERKGSLPRDIEFNTSS